MSNYSKTPTVYQMEATECGAASLAMIFGFFGRDIPLEEARIEVNVTRDGCSAANIMRAAKRHGLECHCYRKEPEKLREIDTPCILHWNFNHFVVFEGFKGDSVYLNDPAVGRRKITFQELDDCFSGVVLTFKTTKAFVPLKQSKTTPTFIIERLKAYAGVLFKLFYIGLLLVFPGMILPVLSQVFMDDILIGGYNDWLTKLLFFMACCVLMKFGLSWYRDAILSKLGRKMNIEYSKSFLSHMFRLPISFFDQRSPGDLVSRMECNNEINAFVADELAETVLNIFVALFYLVVLCLYDPLLTAIALAGVIISLAIVFYSNKVIETVTLRAQMSSGKLYATMCSGFMISDTIKASSVESEYVTKVLGNQAKYVGDVQKIFSFQKKIDALPNAINNISEVLILMIGAILIINGKMTMGMLVAFKALFSSFVEPIKQLISFIQEIQTLKANICRVDDVEKYKEDPCFSAQKSSQYAFNGKVEVKQVTFGYSRLKEPLISDISFSLKPGESIAFVGSSGCGKSTVAKIISGLYKPWEGEVLIDGIHPDEISQQHLNSAVATVSQNITLFSGTIRDNLTMWRSGVSDTTLDEAAYDACIYDDIQALGGYDAVLSENGQNLSGGQRQRLEIARALVTNPAVLIMDEATSALDAKTEAQVLANIKRRGCTCIIVAHRLSAFRDCQQIIVMEHGKSIESGDHKTLMNRGGSYARLVSNI